VPRRERPARRAELLGFSRLGPFQRRLAQDLSGGMKQKLALACTLMHTPELLFLDEPTTGVDPVSRRDFWRILYQLAGRGVTLVVSTPYMDEAERCTRVGLMNHGRLIETDTPQNLRGRMQGEILELTCAPHRRECRRLLLDLPGVKSVEAFGERMHIWLENGDRDQPAVEAILFREGVTPEELRRIPPTLEDVFVSVIEEEEAAQA
jgi:ABC-2 type transport system ATP-binding protein